MSKKIKNSTYLALGEWLFATDRMRDLINDKNVKTREKSLKKLFKTYLKTNTDWR